jgi:hypothetical protein
MICRRQEAKTCGIYLLIQGADEVIQEHPEVIVPSSLKSRVIANTHTLKSTVVPVRPQDLHLTFPHGDHEHARTLHRFRHDAKNVVILSPPYCACLVSSKHLSIQSHFIYRVIRERRTGEMDLNCIIPGSAIIDFILSAKAMNLVFW